MIRFEIFDSERFSPKESKISNLNHSKFGLAVSDLLRPTLHFKVWNSNLEFQSLSFENLLFQKALTWELSANRTLCLPTVRTWAQRIIAWIGLPDFAPEDLWKKIYEMIATPNASAGLSINSIGALNSKHRPRNAQPEASEVVVTLQCDALKIQTLQILFNTLWMVFKTRWSFWDSLSLFERFDSSEPGKL